MVSVVTKVSEPRLSVVAPVHINGIHPNEVTGKATWKEGNIQSTKVLVAITIINPEVGFGIVDLDAEVVVSLTVSLDGSDPLELLGNFFLQDNHWLIVFINGGH